MSTPPVPEKTNPAKRLLKVIDNVRQADVEFQTAWAWAKAFGLVEHKQQHPNLSVKQRTDLMVLLGEFQKEIDELELLIRKTFADDAGHFLEYLVQLRTYSTHMNFGVTVGNDPKLPEGAYASLRHLALFLPNEEVVPAEELTKLLNRIGRLREFVKKSQLDHDFKTWLIGILDEALFKLDQYKLHGGKIFRSVYLAFTAEIADKREEMIKAYRESEEGKSTVEQVFGVWSHFRKFASTGLSMLKFGAAFAGFLGAVADTPLDDSEAAVEHLTGEVMEKLDAIPDNLLRSKEDSAKDE